MSQAVQSKADTTPKIFIAYAAPDLQFAREIYQALMGRGEMAWAAFTSVSSSADWKVQISSAISNASIFLFIVTPASCSLPESLEELELAAKLAKRIIPILRQTVPSELMPEVLRSLKGFNFAPDRPFDRSFDELLHALSNPLPNEASNEASVPVAQQWIGIRKLRLSREGADRAEELMSTPTLAALLARAARINARYENDFDVTFSSVLLAFLASDDPLSRWFQTYVEDARIRIDALLKNRKLDTDSLKRIAAEPLPESEIDAVRRQTSSAVSLIGAAEDLRNRVADQENEPLDVRHLMAAYIYRPVHHESDLTGLGFNRAGWSNAFLGQIAQRHAVELPAWKQVHHEAFPNQPLILAEEGPSTHIATDVWTLNDTLGYRAYAHAIHRFMTHPQTQPPLTISIQAPWGGGKTSLMRMVQHALDPDAFADVNQEAGQPRGEIRISDVLNEVEDWIGKKTNLALPQVPTGSQRKRLTVWFNAWKYESTNQVWAGLADAIIQQIAARLPLAERERFWFRLNLRRVDADTIRRKVYERIVNYWVRTIGGVGLAGLGAVCMFAIALITGISSGWKNITSLGLSGMAVSTLGSALIAGKRFLDARKKVKEEPATISLAEYLSVPNYGAELGFVHQVEADLRRVLASVPASYAPIVIFIDDLDRCSPQKVAQVVEAVNLFLAGDFPNTMFLLGMDTEMVAAALQAAHKDMIACLPTDAGIPIGWRFMDKFVQLPFLIPPAEEGDLSRYTVSLFAQNEQVTADPVADRLAHEAAERITKRAAVPDEARRLKTEHRLTDAQTARLQDQLEAEMVRRKLDEGIEKFNDKDSDIQRVISSGTTYFRGNPRELKRFINAFRFQYFLWWAQRAQGIEGPTIDQLVRWTVLSMKWPEVVRWLRRSGGTEWRPASKNGDQSISSRLALLEQISGRAADLRNWQQEATEILRLDPKITSWLSDDELWEFFHNESALEAGEHLSDGAGKGLW